MKKLLILIVTFIYSSAVLALNNVYLVSNDEKVLRTTPEIIRHSDYLNSLYTTQVGSSLKNKYIIPVPENYEAIQTLISFLTVIEEATFAAEDPVDALYAAFHFDDLSVTDLKNLLIISDYYRVASLYDAVVSTIIHLPMADFTQLFETIQHLSLPAQKNITHTLFKNFLMGEEIELNNKDGDFAVSSAGNLIAVKNSASNQIKIFDIQGDAKQEVGIINPPASIRVPYIYAMKFDKTGKFLFFVANGTLYKYDITQPDTPYVTFTNKVGLHYNNMVFSDDGALMAVVWSSTSAISSIEIIDVNTNAVIDTINKQYPIDKVWGYYFSPQLKYFVVKEFIDEAEKNTLRNLQDRRWSKSFDDEISFLTDQYIAVNKEDVLVYDTDSYKNVYTIFVKDEEEYEITVLPDNKRYIFTHGSTAEIRDIATGTILETISHDDDIEDVIISPDNTLVFIVSDAKTQILDLATNTLVQTLVYPGDHFHTIQFTADKNYIVTQLCESGKIVVWNIKTGQIIYEGSSDEELMSNEGYARHVVLQEKLSEGDTMLILWDSSIFKHFEFLQSLTLVDQLFLFMLERFYKETGQTFNIDTFPALQKHAQQLLPLVRSHVPNKNLEALAEAAAAA